jgi:hypothetical protein
MVAGLLRRRGLATFALLVLITEVVGRGATARVDRRLHVTPLADTGASYYPFLLVGAKVAGALVLAALLARATRVHAAATAGERLLAAVHAGPERRAPRLQVRLSFRIWLASFVATSLVYLVHADVEGLAEGRWPFAAPLLHSYALPVFAVLSVAVALAWRFVRWIDAVEDYARQAFERVERAIGAVVGVGPRHVHPRDDRAPRRRFGIAFESRPPPLAA